MSLTGCNSLPPHLVEPSALGLGTLNVFGELVLAGLQALLHAENHKTHLFDIRLSRFNARLIACGIVGRRRARLLAWVDEVGSACVEA